MQMSADEQPAEEIRRREQCRCSNIFIFIGQFFLCDVWSFLPHPVFITLPYLLPNTSGARRSVGQHGLKLETSLFSAESLWDTSPDPLNVFAWWNASIHGFVCTENQSRNHHRLVPSIIRNWRIVLLIFLLHSHALKNPLPMCKTWYGLAENNAVLNYSSLFLFVCRWADFHVLPFRGRTGRLCSKNSRQPTFN